MPQKLKQVLSSISYICLKHNVVASWPELLPGMNSGSTTIARNEESDQGLIPFLIIKTKEVPQTAICSEGDAALFWDERGIVLEDYMPWLKTITSTT